MSAIRIEVAPELVAEGRRLYETTLLPVDEIAVIMGISTTTLRGRIKLWNWQRLRHDGNSIELLLARRANAAAENKPTPPAANSAAAAAPDFAVLAASLQAAVERELKAVECVLGMLGPSDRGESERMARTLASLARTLRQVALLNAGEEGMAANDSDDDPIPRDIDEFRRELARRIEAFVGERADGEIPRQPKDAGE